MTYPLILDQKQKAKQKQTQHLMMSPKMQQAIHFLQLPIMELIQAIEQEVEKNPILEFEEPVDNLPQEDIIKELPEKEMNFDEHQFDLLKQLDEEFHDHLAESGPYMPKISTEDAKLRTYLESNILAEPSLHDHLMGEAREAFEKEEDLEIAEILIGYIDVEGFIKTPLTEIASSFSKNVADVERVLHKIHTFDPIGIGSRNIQEALLAQLRSQNKTDTMAYHIVELHFDDLLHNRLPLIQKKLKLSYKKLHEIIHSELSRLDFHPLTAFNPVKAPTLIPDVRLKGEEGIFIVEVNDDNMRPLRINRKYLKLLDDETIPMETKVFIKEKALVAKWLIRNIFQRGETLTKIANFIGNYQKDFFASPDGALLPLIIKVVAGELGLHESTIARAIAGKYIDTPRGIFPLRYFFSKAYTDSDGKDVSSKTICQLIVELVTKENKHKPLSDEALSKEIHKTGISCARRTIAKYRAQLNIGNTQQRRHY